jgi:hypothetical protein
VTTYLESADGLLIPRSSNGHAVTEASSHLAMMTELYEATIIDLRIQLQEQSWLRLDGEGGQEFSRDDLGQIVAWARAAYLKNPLINRAVEVAALYVWGQDLSVNAQDERIKAVVDRFWRDNHVTLTGQRASRTLEVEQMVTGNLFLVLFPNRTTGQLLVRSMPMEDIREIITNPDDRAEVWYYRREWTQRRSDGTGPEKMEALYPDLRYRPENRPESLQWGSRLLPIRWESPVLHDRSGAFPHWRWGVPEVYAALDWAKAYKGLLEDDATRSKALAKFAWKIATKGGKAGVAAAKTKLGTTLGANGTGRETNPAPAAGSAFIAGEGTDLEPIKIAGANLDPDHSRPARLMVAAAVGLSDTILSGDVDQSSLATASSLDRPTELTFSEKRNQRVERLGELIQYAIDTDIAALGGILRVTPSEDARKVTLAFPDLLERSVTERVGAISTAAPYLPEELTSRLMMVALGVENVDDEMAALADEEDEPEEPPVPEPLRRVREAKQDGTLTLADIAAISAWWDKTVPKYAGLLNAAIKPDDEDGDG